MNLKVLTIVFSRSINEIITFKGLLNDLLILYKYE